MIEFFLFILTFCFMPAIPPGVLRLRDVSQHGGAALAEATAAREGAAGAIRGDGGAASQAAF